MYKCTHCGTEFEGNFCPECGTKRQEELKLTPPVKPEKVEKPAKDDYQDKKQYKRDLKAYKVYKKQACAYKHDKRRYDKGKAGATPAAVVWLDLHKLWISVAVLALIAVIVISCLISSALSNIFRIGKVSRIELGFTQEQVRKILGEPYTDKDSKDTQWIYYDDTYTNILNKLNKNGEAQEKAILSDNESKLTSLLKEEMQLLEELESLEFKYIEVNFSIKQNENNQRTYIVSNVFFDPKHSADETNTDFKKELKSVKLSSDEVNYYIDNTLEDKTVILKDGNGTAAYTAEFKDGSWLRAGLNNEKSEINGESVAITWQDKYSEYSLTGKAVKIGEVTANGVWTAVIKGTNTYNGKIKPNNTSVTSITIPSSVTEIGDYGFAAFTNLKSVTFHDNITKIGVGAFSGCESLESLTLPENLEEIGGIAFSGCSSIKSVTIPDSVGKVSGGAFSYCTSLEEITIGANINVWPHEMGKVFSHCTSLSKLNISDDNDHYRSENNCIIVKETYSTDIINFIVLGCDTSVITDNITGIFDCAFSGCDDITELTLPASITYIGESPFSESIVDINFGGTKAQWNAIDIRGDWYETAKFTVHCTDGDIKKN